MSRSRSRAAGFVMVRTLLGVLSAPGLQAQGATTDTLLLQRMLVAEDARGLGAEGIAPILEGFQSADTLLRRVAVRGLGRLQRPELVSRLGERLSDPVAVIRAEAANAIIQSLRRVGRSAPATDSGQIATLAAQSLLATTLASETAPEALDALAEAMGRLPVGDSSRGRSLESAILSRVGDRPGRGPVHGLYRLALARRLTGGLSARGTDVLRQQVRASGDTAVRRLAVLTLGLSGSLDSATTLAASRDRDSQVRRLALAGVGGLSPKARASLIRRGLADPSPIVRVDAVKAARVGSERPDCGPIVAAVEDPHSYVSLTAIDALGEPCAMAQASRSALLRVLRSPPRVAATAHRWQAPAHALVALARFDSAAAAPLIPRFAASRRWEERVYAARAAAESRDAATLFRLAHDGDGNVQEAVVAGLQQLLKHEADSVYLATLGSSGFQAVLAAAVALTGSPDPSVPAAVLDALDRLSALRSENAHDPRMELLKRIGELGSPDDAPRLGPYAADFDTTIAVTAAGIVSKWTGVRVEPHPQPLPIQLEPLAHLVVSKGLALQVTLADSCGGGSFVVHLLPDEAPATVARFVRLAESHYYDGHVIQRVEPNFVIQGGGPGATEYMGDAAFMRDELTRRPSFRGTLGVSSRGRDTGDAQFFLNLVDNPVLDHEYTIFGWVESGEKVVEGILEGDVIQRVTVLRRTDHQDRRRGRERANPVRR